MDEPFSDPSLVPTYLLSRFTRKHVTVALGGDGGDELFAGYPMYAGHRWAEVYKHVPGLLRQASSSQWCALPVKDEEPFV